MTPLNPEGQEHVYVLTPLLHVPPSRQGWLAQLSMSVAQFAAVMAPNLGLFVPTKFADITAAQAATLTYLSQPNTVAVGTVKDCEL